MPLKPTSETQEASTPREIDYRKSDSYRNEYANNTFLEHSAWDLKFNFGQLDQSIGPTAVIQHTGISMPWNQVKILVYFLQIHLATYETLNGRIKIPRDVITPLPMPDKETIKNYPNSMDIYKAMNKIYEEFMAANPEAKKLP